MQGSCRVRGCAPLPSQGVCVCVCVCRSHTRDREIAAARSFSVPCKRTTCIHLQDAKEVIVAPARKNFQHKSEKLVNGVALLLLLAVISVASPEAFMYVSQCS